MQVRRVRVRNIRSYESAEVSFPPGTTLVAGDVGAGKTSLLYAIEMALFGVAEVDATYLVRHGAPHAEVEVELEDAEHRYRLRRRFRRVHRRGRETFEPERITFSVDGSDTAYSATELRQRVIDLLGFPDNPNPQAHSDLWRYAVYVPQERMRDILSARPQDRLETVRKALGVERYRTAAENAQELAADLRRTAVTRRAEADRLQHHDREHAEWTLESDRLHLERARLVETIAGRERESEAARVQRATAEAQLRAAEGVSALLESLHREDAADELALKDGRRIQTDRGQEAARLAAELELDRAAAGELPAARASRDEAERSRDEARRRVEQLAEPLRSLARARGELDGARRRVAEAGAELERADREAAEAIARREAVRNEGPAREPPAPTPRSIGELDDLLERSRETERTATQTLTLATRSLTELDELLAGGSCPRCGQSVEPARFEPHRDEARAATRAADAAHRATLDELRKLEEERRARERFERAHERWVEIEKRRAIADTAVVAADQQRARAAEARGQAEAELAGANAQVSGLARTEEEERQARESLDVAEARLRSASERAERTAHAAERLRSGSSARESIAAEIARRDQELLAVERRRTDRRQRIGELERTSADAQARAEELAAAERDLAAAEAALAAERRILVRTETRLDEAARRIAESEKGRSERSGLLTEAEELANRATWVSGPFRSAVLTMEQELLAHAQEAFERSFARYFASLIDDPAIQARTDAAFTPAVTIDEEWTPAEALSGGERTSLALAFRLALAHVVRSMGNLHLDTILLDEPTDGFSPEQVVRMGELLDELALPQVVLVSHELELAAIADRVVRVAKQDGRSIVSPDGGPGPAARDAPPLEDAGAPAAPPPRRTPRRRTDR